MVQDETGRMWRKWKTELITRFRFFRIQNDQDKTDVISIYRAEHIRELIDTLPNEPASDEEERVEFYEIIAKLDHYFTPMINPDSTTYKFEQMSQQEESIPQYYVRLRSRMQNEGWTSSTGSYDKALHFATTTGKRSQQRGHRQASKGDGRNEN